MPDRQLVEALPLIAWISDALGNLVATNQRWSDYTGAAGGRSPSEHVHPDDRHAIEQRWVECRATGNPLEHAIRLRRHDGAYRWHQVRAAPIVQDGEVRGWIGTSTDIEDERRARMAARLIAEAAERLDESLDPRVTAEAAAAIAVPSLADICLIDIVEPDGSLRRVAVAADDSTAPEDVHAARQFATPANGGAPLARAIREGVRVIVPLFDERVVASAARSDEHAALIQRIGPRSALALPLVARGRTLGGLFLMSRTPNRYQADDVELAEDLARRVALALSNAELYAAEQLAREAAEATAARLGALGGLTRSLARAATRDSVAHVATRDGAAALGATAAVLTVATDDGDLELVATEGYGAQATASFRRIAAGEPLPIAQAFRERTAVWVRDAAGVVDKDERVAVTAAEERNASLAAVPLIVEDRVVGVLGLAFRTTADFDAVDRDLVLAQANVIAQALERATLHETRARLLEEVEAQRSRLEAVLRQMPAGVLIADASGQLVLSNQGAAAIWAGPVPADRSIRDAELVAFRPDGTRLEANGWPLVRALEHGETVTRELLEIERLDGARAWIEVDAAPIRDRSEAIVAAVSTFSDVTAARMAAVRETFLGEAATVLASSLDYEETVSRVMRLAVPQIADWAVADLLDANGDLERLAVAHVDPAKVALARELRERYPPDPDAPTGMAAVARTGQSELMPELTPEMFEGIPDPEYRAIIQALDLRSYMSVALEAGGQRLGVLTFLSAGSGRRYGRDDLALAEALASRAAAAIQNARLFRDVDRLRATLDATVDAVLMWDVKAERIAYANRGAVDRLGWSADELRSIAPPTLFDGIDDARLKALMAPLIDRVLASRTMTLALRTRDGRQLPAEVLLQFVEPPGGSPRVVAIARDISERVEAQARLQRLAEAEHARAAELNAVIRAMGEGVVVCDAQGRIILTNPAAAALFPDASPDTYRAILAGLDDPQHEAPRLGRREGPVELRLRGDGERWVELSTYPVGSGDGPVPEGSSAETIVLLRDVSLARQRQAVRDTFIGVLSHELRTPVTTIFAGSKVLARDGGLDEETRRSVFEDIHVEAERLHRLVEDVIALTRFGEVDEADIGRDPVLLQRILPGVVRSEQARWPGVRFELHIPSGAPTVIADPTYVEQVVRNLLSNAAKYGGPSAVVRTSLEADDDEVRVRILDTGPGFPPEEAERLFDLFFRSPSTAGSASGAGIGLFVCARLIRAMGGRIWARSRPEGGAEFGFSLRVMDDELLTG